MRLLSAAAARARRRPGSSRSRARSSCARAGPPHRASEPARQKERARSRSRPAARARPGGRRARSRRATRPGCPGSPNTSVRPRTPNATGLPGRTATRQNTSSTPSSASAARTRSCGPTETPPDVTSTSAARPRSSAASVASASSATGASTVDVGAGGLELRSEQRRVGLVDLARRERRAGRPKLAAGRKHGDAGPAGGATRRRAPAAARAPISVRAKARAGSGRHRTRGCVAATRADVGARRRRSDRDRVVLDARLLDRHNGVGACRDDRARSRSPLPRPAPASRRTAGPPPTARSPARRPGVSSGANGEPVHRRAVERRQVDQRRSPARRALGRQRAEPARPPPERRAHVRARVQAPRRSRTERASPITIIPRHGRRPDRGPLSPARAARRGAPELGLARRRRAARPACRRQDTDSAAADPTRFRREARTVALLSHPNICTLSTTVRTAARRSSCSSYLPGGSLEEALTPSAAARRRRDAPDRGRARGGSRSRARARPRPPRPEAGERALRRGPAAEDRRFRDRTNDRHPVA